MTTPTHLLTGSATISRPTVTVDAGGSPISTYSNATTGVSCRVVSRGGSESPRYGRENARYSYDVYFAGGTDVRQADRIVVNSKTLEIQALVDFDEQGILLRAGCEETKP